MERSAGAFVSAVVLQLADVPALHHGSGMPAPSILSMVLICATTAAAHATGGISCEGPNVRFSILTGRLPVLSVLSARFEIDGRIYATDAGDGTSPIAFGQGMVERRRIAADFTDGALTRIVLRYRHGIDDAGTPHREGRLTVDGRTIPVRCTFE